MRSSRKNCSSATKGRVEKVISLDGDRVRKYANDIVENVGRVGELEKEILSEARNNGASENRCALDGVIASAAIRFDFPLLPLRVVFIL